VCPGIDEIAVERIDLKLDFQKILKNIRESYHPDAS
jgi:hypothetical protein